MRAATPARVACARRRLLHSVALGGLALLSAIVVLSSCADEPKNVDPTRSLQSHFGPDLEVRRRGAFGLDKWKVVGVDAREPFDKAVRVEFPAGSASPSAARRFGSPEGGMQAYLRRIEGPVDDGYLRYGVRLSPDFDFRKGGKLPGLWGGTQVSGGRKPNGKNGFSTRLMWRAQGAGEVYLYAAGTAGKSLGRGSWRWQGGRWACVEEHVVLNDPGKANGLIEVWLDGKKVYENSRLRYRTVRSLKIEGIFFSTFFGGGDPSWASPRDQYAEFAGLKISTERIGCRQ